MSLIKKATYVMVTLGWALAMYAIISWGEGPYITILIAGIILAILGEVIKPTPELVDIIKNRNQAEGEVKARFSIISSDDKRDKIAELIKELPHMGSINGEEGRQYSRPDDDDNEKWYALRVSCEEKHRDNLMQSVKDKIRAELGNNVADELRIDYY